MNEIVDQSAEYEEPEGLENQGASLDDYPLDEMMIRNEHRTVRDVLHRIEQKRYVMDPDFQRDFIWPEIKQSKLIESVLMRIPLPVFYVAEDPEGRMVVVDGLQRLSTFERFVNGKLELQFSDSPGSDDRRHESRSSRPNLHGKYFDDLHPKFRNRVEDCNLIFYIIDSKAPERAKLDIFERVNGGLQLTRQQMRNCLYMGQATRFLREEAQTDIFKQATGGSLNSKTMRDREFVNRFCAFQILDVAAYQRDDMDDFLAESLRRMNKMTTDELSELSVMFRRSLSNNYVLFERHAFRKNQPGQTKRSVLNASFWDVMSTGLSRYSEAEIEERAEPLRSAIHRLLRQDEFNMTITYSTNSTKKVKRRFELALTALQKAFE